MRQFYISFCLFLIFLSAGYGQQSDTLFILQTTDVHGNVRDYNYFSDTPANYGLSRIYSRVTEYRQKHKNVVLVDGGDLLQGTPLIYYFNTIEANRPNPMILALNYMGYDAFAVGNHDIEQGLFVYNRAERESQFPWLSANSILPDGRSYFKPYTIIERNGIKIGIIGLTTPGIPMWLDKNLYPGITWSDMIRTARKYVKLLRPQVDVLVGLFHAGFESNYSKATTDKLGLPNENASGLVAEQVPGFDVVFAGHSHRWVPAEGVETIKSASRPLRINAGSWAKNLGVAQLILSKITIKNRNSIPPSHWKIEQAKGWLESMQEVAPSPAILELTDYYHKKTLSYIRQAVAQLNGALDASRSRYEDNALVELINKAQLDYTGADISFAASFNTKFKMQAGPVLIKDIYSMYRYENFLYKIEMSGQQILDYLKFSSRFYQLNDQNQIIANPEMAGYNYDMAEGLGYKILVRQHQPAAAQTGDPHTRPNNMNIVQNLVVLKTGEPLDLAKKYKVAMNSYRASGGGGHLQAAGIQNPKILSKSNVEMRTILISYFKKLKNINTQINHNWEAISQQ